MQYSLENLKRIKQRDHELQSSDLLFDRHNVIAINKPPGLPTQATRDQSVVHLEAAVKKHLATKGLPNAKVFLVHRLDKETSGVVLLATTAEAVTFLTDQFRNRTVNKEYLALCSGIPHEKKFTVECFLSPIDKRTGNVTVVRSGGKPSKTFFEVIESNKALGLSLIRCRPETGRSHQIRVHLASKGFPIIGDKKYQPSKTPMTPTLESLAAVHHLLHAFRLTFVPGNNEKPVTLEAPLPINFLEFLKAAAFSSK